MVFEFWPALLAGIIGGAVMAGMRMVAQVAGIDLKMDMPRTWGSMLRDHGGPGRLLGMAVHLIVSGAIALIYAWVFDWIGADDDLWLWGLLGGTIHWVIAGFFVAMMPAMHPEIPERRPAPGAFVKNFGAPDVPAFLMGHLLYGVVVGILYAYFHSAGGTDIAF
jgi:hypothetical protein